MLTWLAGAGLSGTACSQSISTGRVAPDFSLSDLDGKSVSLSSQKGSVVLLTFWAVG
jgi:peroxiredoxin